MKKILLIILGMAPALGMTAQLPKWVIPPVNDTIFVKEDNCLLQTAEGRKSSLWTMDGNKVYSTDNTIQSFSDGVAAVTSSDNTIVGIVDSEGKFTAIPTVSVAFGDPTFHDGYLAVNDGENIVYYKKDGRKADFPQAIKAYPFHRGYAPYLAYDQPDKKKDARYGYYKADGQPFPTYVYSNGESKYVEPKNIEFLSAVGSNGKGVGVIKGKLYWFIPENKRFEPMLWGDGDSEKKRHLSLAEDYEKYFRYLPLDGAVIQAKYGKNQFAELRFDDKLVPVYFNFGGEEMKFSAPQKQASVYKSGISSFGERQFGLSLDNRKALPEQFDKVGLCYGNRAMVKKNGKWGVVEIHPDLDFSLRINKGDDVAFRHQKFETQVRLDFPAAISSKDARIEIPDSTGCILDKTSRETKDTESGNFLTYNCTLNIPQSLPDTITTITYSPVSISYDGLKLFDVTLPIKAWHLKYYNVDPIESETMIANGVASFTININAQRIAGEGDYSFEAKVEADSVAVEYEKLSETRYKYFVSNLKEGENILNILVIEKGCPPSVFPFEIYYTKPVPRKKKKEEVVVRKVTPDTKKHTPRLEI